MTEHIRAWNSEYKNWRGGNYTLDLLEHCRRSGRLLDAGCGGGKYTLPLRIRGFDVVAVDVSPNALRIAGERSAKLKLDIGFLAADIRNMPFHEASFDVIWCYGVLQHLLSKERKSAIFEFKRLLRDDGILFIEVFGKEDMRFGGKEVEPSTFSRKNGIIYHYFDKTELEEFLSGFSYRIIESRKEKKFNGEYYTRHMISVIAKKL